MSKRRRGAKAAPASPIDDIDAVRDAGAQAHYADPAYYAHAYRARAEDVAYYVKLAVQHGGPVLEYGVGNGRIALALGRAGLEVVGVDCSRPMLEALESRLAAEPALRDKVRAVEGDMRTLRLGQRFPLVIAPFNVVLHLYQRRDVEAFFARVREHLAPGGRFVFDFSVPQPEDLARDATRRFGAPRFRHPSTGELVRYAERFEYHPVRQLLIVWMEFSPESGGEPWVVPLSHRQFFPQEMEALLHYNGFSDIRMTADFTGRAPTGSVDCLVVSSGVGGPEGA